jgi:hypothetical protein
MAVNAKAVVDIDVDDKAFKSFMVSFEKYQRVLAKTPSAWAAVSKENKIAFEAFNRMTAALMAQGDIMRKNVSAQKDLAVSAHAVSRDWEKTKDHATKFYEKIKDTTWHLIKWTGIFAGIGSLAASFTTLWGLQAAAEGIRARQASASGVGLSSGQQKALELNFGDTFDVPGLTRGVETARADRRSKAFRALGKMHIGRGLSAHDQNRAVLNAAWEASHKLGRSQWGGWIERQGAGEFGITTESMERAHGMSREEFQGVMGRESKEAGEVGFKEKSAKAWSEFLHMLEKAKETIGSALVDEIAKLMPCLSKLTDRITNLITNWLRGGGLDNIIGLLNDGLDWLVKFFGEGGGFKKDVIPALIEFGVQLKAITHFFKTDSSKYTPEQWKNMTTKQRIHVMSGGIYYPNDDPDNPDAPKSTNIWTDAGKGIAKGLAAGIPVPSGTPDPNWKAPGTDAVHDFVNRVKGWFTGANIPPPTYGGDGGGGGGGDGGGATETHGGGRRGQAGQRRSGGRSTAAMRMGFTRRGSSAGGGDGGGGGGGGGGRGGHGAWQGGGKVPGLSDPGTSAGDIKTLMGFGWSYENAVGIVTNILAESSGRTDAVGDGGLAYGLAQWHPDRQAEFKKLFGHDIRQSTRLEQLKFIDWELKHTEAGAGQRLMAEHTAGGSAGAFSQYYERPAAVQEARYNRSHQGEQLAYKIPRVQVDVRENTGGNVHASASTL